MKTFVIHYEKLVDRKNAMMQQLCNNNMETDTEFVSNKSKDVLTDEEKSHFSKKLTDGEISLFIHHIECYKKLIEDPEHHWAIVFEDDAIFESNFKETLQKYMGQMPNEWDVLFIGDGCLGNERKGTHIPQDKIIPGCNIYKKNVLDRDCSAKCLDSYIISKKSAKKFVNEYNKQMEENIKFDCPVDFWLTKTIIQYDMNLYWAEPTIVKQGSEYGFYSSSVKERPK
jgi:GR25 family glycosyltransferase involved in LPS biosynthesis